MYFFLRFKKGFPLLSVYDVVSHVLLGVYLGLTVSGSSMGNVYFFVKRAGGLGNDLFQCTK